MCYTTASTSGFLNTQSVNASLNYVLTSEQSTNKGGTIPEAAAPARWDGVYAGLNLSAGWGASCGNANNWNLDALRSGFTYNVAANGAGGGVIGGGQIGYNYAVSPLLPVGAETDFQGASSAVAKF